MKKIIYFMLDGIGFSSFSDIIQSAFALKYKISTIYVFAFSIGGALNAIQVFTEKYIYSPPLGIAILWAASLLDVILGVSASVEASEGIEPNRLIKALIRALVQTFLVGLVFHMSKVWSSMLYDFMIESLVDSLLLLFVLTVFYSALQNAHKLGILTDDQYETIESVANLKHLINRFKKK